MKKYFVITYVMIMFCSPGTEIEDQRRLEGQWYNFYADTTVDSLSERYNRSIIIERLTEITFLNDHFEKSVFVDSITKIVRLWNDTMNIVNAVKYEYDLHDSGTYEICADTISFWGIIDLHKYRFEIMSDSIFFISDSVDRAFTRSKQAALL